MRASTVLVVVVVSGLLAASCQAAVLPTTCPGNEVNCLVDPCSVTTCKPSNPAWQCTANYCGGCNAVWTYTTTGLVVNTCPPDVCTQIFDPVCGTDGKTYGSACSALTSGAAVASKGECPPAPAPTPCKPTRSPVCGADGKTYRNKCQALQAGTTALYAGSCSFPTQCAKANLAYAPVCDAASGLTWTNACTADLNKVTGYTDGPCIGGACARCTSDSGCNAPHPCKGSPKYTCEQAACRISHILDDGRRVTYGLCSAIYKCKATGYPAAACYQA